MKPEIIFQTPSWYIILCILVGFGFSFLLYYKSKSYGKTNTKVLASIRAILSTLLCFLLLNPLLKTIQNVVLKPKIVLVLDNSKSMLYAGKNALKELTNNLGALKNNLTEKGFETEIVDLQNNIVSDETLIKGFDFGNSKTNYSEILKALNTNYEGQNLSDVILISDGILNDGVSPNYQKYNFAVHTVGIGDTLQKKDVFISGLTANNLAYLGNKFIVNVDLGSYLYSGKSGKVEIKDASGKVLSVQSVSFTNNEDFKSLSFELTANKVGKQRIIVEVSGFTNEFSLGNNKREIIVDVVNGKEKVLIVAYAPHPDIKALKSIIESNDLFELKIQILQSNELAKIGVEPFDILILHQLPDVYGTSTGLVSGLLSKQKPTFFVIGSRTNISIYNGMQNVVGINSQLNKLDKTTPTLNPSFNLFNIAETSDKVFENLPPLTVPFGEYKIYPGVETLLFQKIADIKTVRPLLALNLNSLRKSGVLVGEGLWQWRQEEYANNGNNLAIDNLIIKSLQLLSVKTDKNKLRVYPLANNFDVDQKIIFEAETYNDLYEKVYEKEIKLKINSDNGIQKTFDFTNSKDNSRLIISNLPAGVYSYTATSNLLGKNEVNNGQFVVTASDLEALNSVANFNLMKSISNENNGFFETSKNLIELRNKIQKSGLIEKIISNEDLKDFINLRWILILLIILASVEWVFRKYLGNY